MAENEEVQIAEETHQPEIPTGRIKKIMKIDKEINRVSSEALYLISCSTELFIQFLAEKSARVALEKKKKTIKLEHLRVAVKRHQPTSDFLLDSLPVPSQPSDQHPKDRLRLRPENKPAPAGTRRIDAFFNKCT
ncbi:hypothetical protein M9H77_10317 [Catharanthus roseus]|uniref:Uncharacterized protein n=1 Tax=Catharanthus roseus TaxID=4058 RepID=A0ACC0C3B2_CATRO|nr:hypothetical protein M9H77_10317 [Catharanthus roseus]